MKRPNFSVISYLVLVFLSGVLVGVVGFGLYNARSVSASLKTNPCTATAVRQRYMADMESRLKLQPEQVQRLSGILEGTHDRFKALRLKYKPEVTAIQDEQATSIRGMLNESQRAEYEKIRREREQAERTR
jgi:hypothetical protein